MKIILPKGYDPLIEDSLCQMFRARRYKFYVLTEDLSKPGEKDDYRVIFDIHSNGSDKPVEREDLEQAINALCEHFKPEKFTVVE